MMLKLQSNGVAYAATTFAANLMHSMFMFYYVKIYMNYFHVSDGWFQASQVIFMIWNAVNDPLFGYLQDNPPFAWFNSRRHCILYGAPLFAFTFVLPWFPWGDYTSNPTWLAGFQLMTCLCLYDATFTFVLLAQCALFAEISPAHSDRIMLVRYSQIGGLLGSCSVFFSEYVSVNLEHFHYFQFCTVLVGVVACAAMMYTGSSVRSPRDLGYNPHSFVASEAKSPYTWWQLTFQIFRSPSFISFVIMNFLQIYHMTYISNFVSIICDALVPKEYITASTRSIMYGAMFIVPQILVILCTPLVEKIGNFQTIRLSFVLRIVGALFICAIGQSPFIVLVFFLFDSALTNGVFSLFNICLSDIIDEDIQKYNRKNPISSLIFGTNALITKPAMSFSPLITLYILESHGYKDANSDALTEGADTESLHQAMYQVMWMTPLMISALQLVVWSFYRIRNSHTTVAVHLDT